MSFLDKFFGFFTLKTSAEVRESISEQKAIEEDNSPENDWRRSRNDLDYITDGAVKQYSDFLDNLMKSKEIIHGLLGSDLVCLLNTPILQQAVINVENNKREGAIHLQWASGNERDEMTVMSVGFNYNGLFRLTCASKCIGPESNHNGVYVSEFGDANDLPEWFKNILELIKEVHIEHVRAIDVESDLNLDKLINEVKTQFKPRIKAAKICGEVISYVLHDEYQDMAYYPNIGFSSIFDSDASFTIVLTWKLGDDRLRLRVTYHYCHDLGITVEFCHETRNKQVTTFNELSETAAKNVRLPKWFTTVLDKVKK